MVAGRGLCLEDQTVVLGSDDERYFERLEESGVILTPAQKRWWVKKAETLGGDMKREYTATPDEAFEQALEGAYFAQDLFVAAKQGRIGGFPYDPRTTVQTFWDLGRNDLNTIWLHQHVDGYDRFIGYYENSGEFIGHYVAWLNAWAKERSATFGDHYIPHDGDRESLWLESGTKGVMQGLGFYPTVVERPRNKLEAISAARCAFRPLPVRRAVLFGRPQASARLPQGMGGDDRQRAESRRAVEALAAAYIQCAADTTGEFHAVGAALAGSEEKAAVLRVRPLANSLSA